MKILKVKTEKRKIGDIGERAAVRFLKKSGYKILKKNFVAEGYEIDIVASKRDIIAFIEVKTRTHGKESPYEIRPASAVTPDKQKKIIQAAIAYCGFYYMQAKGKMRRLDIIEVLLDGRRVSEVSHMEGAFNRNSAMPKHKF